MTIHEILAHPDYRRFAREVTECGRQLVPDVFPWRFMGMSDAELATADLTFDHGTPIDADYREALIRVVRHHEGLLLEHWAWWRGRGDACVALPPPEEFIAFPTVGEGGQMELFSLSR